LHERNSSVRESNTNTAGVTVGTEPHHIPPLTCCDHSTFVRRIASLYDLDVVALLNDAVPPSCILQPRPFALKTTLGRFVWIH
jgi:hypothetical protein